MTYYDGGIMDTCDAYMEPWFCTEPVDHPRGEHVACGMTDDDEYARWPLTDPE